MSRMRKNLAALGLATILLASCGEEKPAPQLPISVPQNIYSAPKKISGMEMGQERLDDIMFDVQLVALDSDRDSLFYAENNINQRDGELDFILRPYSESSFVRDRQTNQITTPSNRLIVLRKAKTPEGEIATKATLTAKGPYAARAKEIPFTQEELENGIVTLNENHFYYNLKKVTIKGKDYFFPAKVGNCGQPFSQYDFFVIPVEGAKDIILPDKRIQIISAKGIYESVIISAKDYENRRIEDENKSKGGVTELSN